MDKDGGVEESPRDRELLRLINKSSAMIEPLSPMKIPTQTSAVSNPLQKMSTRISNSTPINIFNPAVKLPAISN